jgi:hypothetical protein
VFTENLHPPGGAVEGSDKRQFFAVLHQPPVTSPVEAVRAAIVAENREKSHHPRRAVESYSSRSFMGVTSGRGLLRGIAERGALAPLFFVATTRPEFRPPWGMRSHHGTISLAPLDRAQVRDMVAELSARHALPKEVVEDVAARTGGVPLFVEEVTRLLLERGEQGGMQAIPPTLQQSLTARLDRLGPAREVAQVGSVIGRGFS